MEEPNEIQDLISELRILRDLAIVYACINLASRNAKNSYFKLEEKERHAKEHDEIREPRLFKMVVLTISSDGLSLIPAHNTQNSNVYSSFPKIREQVPEIKNETIQPAIIPNPTFCRFVGV